MSEVFDDAKQQSIRVACVQLASNDDRQRNVAAAERHVAAAAADGAQLVLLPEKWNCIGDAEVLRANAEMIDGPSITAARSWARDHGIWLIAGSFAETVAGQDKLSNTSVVIAPDGEITATYRKMHMFDVVVGGVTYRESDAEQAGTDVAVTQAAGLPVGLSICYDLRFPELYRLLALGGAQLITVPAAFTMFTGKDHWEVLLRARAIENQCFVLAADVMGDHGGGKVSYGRSMIVDPWGIVLATAPDRESHIIADLDLADLQRIRRELPALANRQAAAYRWPDNA